jgi:fructose-1,6-bisphosphatase-3
VEHTSHRRHVQDTDIGVELQSQIEDLKELLEAYRSGDLKERNLRPITNKT